MMLRIHIDGDWSAAQFAEFYEALDEYYRFISLRYRTFAFDSRDNVLGYSIQASQPLRVRATKYGSKGFSDLLGIAGLIKEFREFLQFLILHFRDSEDRHLTRQERKLAIAHSKVDLLEKLASISARAATEDGQIPLQISAEMSEFLDLPNFEPLAEAILDGRLLNAEIIVHDDEQ